MRPMVRTDILSRHEYEQRRKQLRAEAVQEKNRRRLAVGDHCTLLFESFTTLWYQVQEMIRVEKLDGEREIRHEMDTYNELMPGKRELSATLLIEYIDTKERDRELKRLLGIDEHVWLVVGDVRVPAIFDKRQIDTERVSSVQFIKFELGGVTPAQFRDADYVAIEIDHEHMKAVGRIEGETKTALAGDLELSEEEKEIPQEPVMAKSNEFKIDLETIKKRAREHMLDGALTGAYKLDPNKVIAVLNETLATEIVCILRYKNHFFMASGINADPVAQEFLVHANEEQMHADWISTRIVQLGGVPDLNPEGLLTRAHADYVEGTGLKQMIEENLVAERVAIETYTEVIQWLGTNDPTTRRIMEDILKMEEEHADDLASMLSNL